MGGAGPADAQQSGQPTREGQLQMFIKTGHPGLGFELRFQSCGGGTWARWRDAELVAHLRKVANPSRWRISRRPRAWRGRAAHSLARADGMACEQDRATIPHRVSGYLAAAAAAAKGADHHAVSRIGRVDIRGVRQ
jgi:hypothetical protein